MITSLRLVNFKNFADETLRVGPFTVIVGANASGKSNIRDASRFLHGIGRAYTLAEIIGGKYGSGGQREWEPIRGGTDEIIQFGESAFSLQVESTDFDY
ncbi:MAG: AAA family ATPase, partial [Gammaproteobacteria bacterium]|nr:AAA family ATPase [Gammaproteobacteria bacterium]